jgi:uncharacterized protein YbjT (DUF2867 family)
MPVVVTGADTPVGRALIPMLLEGGSEVRAVVQDAGGAEPLRALGAKVAVVAASDDDTLRAILDDAHTVCLLSADLFLPSGETYEETIVESTRAVLRAARKAKVRRVLLVSYPGASPTSANDFLRSTGLAEDAVRDSSPEHAILRCTHIYGAGSPWLDFMVRASRSRPQVVIGSGAQRLAPVYSVDVARALAAADDRAQPVSGTYALEGPDQVTANELAELLGGSGHPKRHVPPGARPPEPALVSGRLDHPWSQTIGEVLAEDCLADGPGADQEFGLERTSLIAGLETSGVEPIPIDTGRAHPDEAGPPRDRAI